MSRRSIGLSEELYDYLLQVSLREPPLFTRLRTETSRLPGAAMQISPEQGQFMALLVEILDVRRAIEIGTFTGYSALAIASAMPRDGRLITCDIDADTTSVARRYWQEAGVGGRIELRLGPALKTLDDLSVTDTAAFDFAFIDADKQNYVAYYENLLKLVRPGGLIAIDNVLWGGSVVDPADTDPDTEAIRMLNRLLHDDRRVTLSMLPIGDGLTLARVRGPGHRGNPPR